MLVACDRWSSYEGNNRHMRHRMTISECTCRKLNAYNLLYYLLNSAKIIFKTSNILLVMHENTHTLQL